MQITLCNSILNFKISISILKLNTLSIHQNNCPGTSHSLRLYSKSHNAQAGTVFRLTWFFRVSATICLWPGIRVGSILELAIQYLAFLHPQSKDPGRDPEIFDTD